MASVACGAGSLWWAGSLRPQFHAGRDLWPQLHVGRDLCGLSSMRGGISVASVPCVVGWGLCGLGSMRGRISVACVSSTRADLRSLIIVRRRHFEGLAIYSGAGAPTHPTKARGNQGRKTESGEGGLEPTSGHLSHCGTLREEGVPNAWIFIWRNGVPTHPPKTREKQGRNLKAASGPRADLRSLIALRYIARRRGFEGLAIYRSAGATLIKHIKYLQISWKNTR